MKDLLSDRCWRMDFAVVHPPRIFSGASIVVSAVEVVEVRLIHDTGFVHGFHEGGGLVKGSGKECFVSVIDSLIQQKNSAPAERPSTGRCCYSHGIRGNRQAKVFRAGKNILLHFGAVARMESLCYFMLTLITQH